MGFELVYIIFFVNHGCFTVSSVDKLPNISTSIYPTAHRDETIIDDYHGIKVADPYRWLEELDTPETQQYMNELNAISEPFFADAPNREQIRTKLNELNDYEKLATLGKQGNFYYYAHNKGLQNQYVIFQQKNFEDDGDIFLDPSDLSAGGTASLGAMSWSADGSMLAYVVSEKGSDLSSIRFRDVHKHDLADIIANVKFTNPSWMKDNSGIFYSAYQNRGVSHSLSQKDENQTIYFHQLGTDSAMDKLIYGTNLPIIGGYVTNDGKYLIIHVGVVSRNMLFYYDLSDFDINRQEPINPKPLFDQLDGKYKYIDHDNDSMLIYTNRGAPNYKIIRVSLVNGSVADVVPEDKLNTIVAAYAVASDRLLIQYLKDVKHTLQVHDLQSGAHLHTLSLIKGTVNGVVSKKNQNEVFFALETMLTPSIAYRLDFSQNTSNPKLERLRQSIGKEMANENDISVQQVFYNSKDGTKIPMHIVSLKNVSKNGDAPLLLEGYGGSMPLMPRYKAQTLLFVKHFNGIVAVANIRGGGEYGERWHEDGILEHKQNVFDDFIAAAEYLISNNYTKNKSSEMENSSLRLKETITVNEKEDFNMYFMIYMDTCKVLDIGYHWASNGGLLVAVCAQQRPDLYGAVVGDVGVFDMLRYHKFTIGPMCIGEYGDPDKADDFKFIYSYSPLHNIRYPIRGQWPSTLMMTADYDDRAVPSHTLKYAATLYDTVKAHPQQTNPLLFRIEHDAGHGCGKPLNKQIAAQVNVFSFLQKVLKLEWKS